MNDNIDIQRTGRRIKYMCQLQGVSVKKIQQNLSIGAHQSIYAWFQGKTLPSLDNLYRLSKFLNIPMDCLVVGTRNDIKYEKRISQEERLISYYISIKSRVA